MAGRTQCERAIDHDGDHRGRMWDDRELDVQTWEIGGTCGCLPPFFHADPDERAAARRASDRPRVQETTAPASADVSRSRSARLTEQEARHALYVDFEGRIDQPPVLVGCARRPGRGSDPWVWQAVLDDQFALIAKEDELPVLTISDAVERIVQRAEAHDLVIVAWSEHELEVVDRYCAPDIASRFRERFVNGKKVASRWTGRQPEAQRPPTKRLVDYLAFIGYPLPAGAGPGRAGETIGILAAALARHGSAQKLTSLQRTRWAELRAHNQHDCNGMRRVCLRAARELEQAEVTRARPSRRRRRRARRRLAAGTAAAMTGGRTTAAPTADARTTPVVS